MQTQHKTPRQNISSRNSKIGKQLKSEVPLSIVVKVNVSGIVTICLVNQELAKNSKSDT